MPWPKLVTSFPSASNLRMLGSGEISPVVRFRQRVRAAPLADPDRPAVAIDLHRARRTPRPALGHLRPLLDRAVRDCPGRRRAPSRPRTHEPTRAAGCIETSRHDPPSAAYCMPRIASFDRARARPGGMRFALDPCAGNRGVESSASAAALRRRKQQHNGQEDPMPVSRRGFLRRIPGHAGPALSSRRAASRRTSRSRRRARTARARCPAGRRRDPHQQQREPARARQGGARRDPRQVPRSRTLSRSTARRPTATLVAAIAGKFTRSSRRTSSLGAGSQEILKSAVRAFTTPSAAS